MNTGTLDAFDRGVCMITWKLLLSAQ